MFRKIAIAVGVAALAVGKVHAAPAEEPQYLHSLPPVKKSTDPIYPDHSLRLDEEGAAKASFWIEKTGRTSRCSIVSSSGFFRLDEATCKTISKMTFENRSGGALGPFIVPIQWRLDEPDIEDPILFAVPNRPRGVYRTNTGELQSGQRVNLGLYLDVSPEGVVIKCTVRWASESPILNQRACEIASKWRYGFRKSGVTTNQSRLETFYFADPAAGVLKD